MSLAGTNTHDTHHTQQPSDFNSFKGCAVPREVHLPLDVARLLGWQNVFAVVDGREQ